MPATLHCEKCVRKEDGWHNPVNDDFVSDSDAELFCIYAKNTDTGEAVISFVLDRTALEQVEHGMHKALTIEPVRIRRA